MKVWSPKIFFGAFLLAIFLILTVAVFVYPYSKLLGKERIEFNSSQEEKELSPPISGTRAVLPVFDGLKVGSFIRASDQVFLTINKLGIKKVPIRADVFVDNVRPDYLNALLTTLAHLKGTPYPGEKGNSIIFGHSALTYLYNPRNFQTIFTRLDELKFGDLIIIEMGPRLLKFQVEKGGLLGDRATVSDLASRKARLTLITCYPPGYKSFIYAVTALLLE